MNVAERLERLEEALTHLRRVCEGALVLVEGRRDAFALEQLGVGGTPRLVNEPGSVEDMVDALSDAPEPVVVLTDWDRTGGRLARRFHDALVGRSSVDLEARRRLAAACHCKCLEHVPAELAGLRAKVGMRR